MEGLAEADAVQGRPASIVAITSATKQDSPAAAGQHLKIQAVEGMDWQQQGDDLLIENVPTVVVEHRSRSGRVAKRLILQEHSSGEELGRGARHSKKRQGREDEDYNISSSPGSLPEDELWEVQGPEEPPLPPGKKQRQSGKDKGPKSGHKSLSQAISGRATSGAAVSVIGCMPTGGAASGKAMCGDGSKATAPKASGAARKARQSAAKGSGAVAKASEGAAEVSVREAGKASGAAVKTSGAVKDIERRAGTQQEHASNCIRPRDSCAHHKEQPCMPGKAGSQKQCSGLDASFMEPDVSPRNIQEHQPAAGSQQQRTVGLQDKEPVWGSMVFTCAAPAAVMQHDTKATGKASGKHAGKASGTGAGKTSGKLANKTADVSGKTVSKASGNVHSKVSTKASGHVSSGAASGKVARKASAGASKQIVEAEPVHVVAAAAGSYQQPNMEQVQVAMQEQLPAAVLHTGPADSPAAHHNESCKSQPGQVKPPHSSLLHDAINTGSAPRNPKLAAFAALCKARTAAAEATAARPSASKLGQEPAAAVRTRASGGARTSGGGAASGGPASGPGLAGGMFACPQTAKYRGPGLRRPAGKSMLVRRQ